MAHMYFYMYICICLIEAKYVLEWKKIFAVSKYLVILWQDNRILHDEWALFTTHSHDDEKICRR